ncbi:hypothetical protein ACFQ3L_06660 [Lacticaseibacillus jixianensis]|uniref:Uncharacterized protein n=1 Tax=Lacticaseibacillus jixianensis TaxID=2486012 RepID=A0ABW4B966_9LACO|nr:hypothetical protein [Lacticaseibacillus jixianensis]
MKRMTMYIVELTLALLSLMAISVLINHFFGSGYFSVSYITSLIVVVNASSHSNRQRAKHLTQMLALADQLGYGPADLKQLEPRYGVIDWQLSHPEKMQFYPSDTLVKKLTKQFETELFAERPGVHTLLQRGSHQDWD